MQINIFFITIISIVRAQRPVEFMKNNDLMGTFELLNFVRGRGW